MSRPKIELHEVAGFIEGVLNIKEYEIVIFFDIEEAFNNINPRAIITVLSNICDNENIVLLVGNLLIKRPISATPESTNLKRIVCRGSPLGGALNLTA